MDDLIDDIITHILFKYNQSTVYKFQPEVEVADAKL